MYLALVYRPKKARPWRLVETEARRKLRGLAFASILDAVNWAGKRHHTLQEDRAR